MLSEYEKVSIDDIRKILKYFSKGYKLDPAITDVIKKVAHKEIEDKKRVVLFKRDPNVERNRIQGSYVKLIDGATVELHPVVVKGPGADFDGDQMAIIAVLSNEAQDEIKRKMITTKHFDRLNGSTFTLSNEMLIGIFTITFIENNNKPVLINNVSDAEKLDIGDTVKINTKSNGLITTTAGRVIFNSALPSNHSFVNEPVNAKVVNKLLDKIIQQDKNEFARTIDKLCKMGFEYATKYPQTISLDMLMVPESLKKMARDLEKELNVNKQIAILDEMDTKLMDYLRDHQKGLYITIASGAGKGGSQLRQVMVAKGLISNASGELLPPIGKSLLDGFDSETYLESAAGSRKGLIDKALNTAHGGYAYRKMVFAMGTAECDITNADCGTKRGMKLKLTQELFSRMNGRYFINPKTKVIEQLTKNYIGQIMEIRSPMFCKSRRICRTCYGDLIYQIQSQNAGVLAAQACASLSEKIMKCSTGLIETEDGIITLDELWNKV